MMPREETDFIRWDEFAEHIVDEWKTLFASNGVVDCETEFRVQKNIRADESSQRVVA